MKPPAIIIPVVLAAFAAHYALNEFFFADLYRQLAGSLGSRALGYFLAYVVVGLPVVGATIWLHGTRGAVASLGLDRRPWPALGRAFLFSLPMLIGFAVLYPLNRELTVTQVLATGVCAAFFEELYFRGFLFGQLFRFTRLGFVPAIALGAVVFALGHLHQSQDPAVLIGVFATTFLGAVFFAWLYAEWDFNLWVPIGLHFFMNLHWMVFGVADNALGSPAANILRALTIAAAIIGTRWHKRRQGRSAAVTWKTLWRQPVPNR